MFAPEEAKKTLCAGSGAPLRQYSAANQEWALDFVHDVLAAGRTIRVLECSGRVYARMSGTGSRHQLC